MPAGLDPPTGVRHKEPRGERTKIFILIKIFSKKIITIVLHREYWGIFGLWWFGCLLLATLNKTRQKNLLLMIYLTLHFPPQNYNIFGVRTFHCHLTGFCPINVNKVITRNSDLHNFLEIIKTFKLVWYLLNIVNEVKKYF